MTLRNEQARIIREIDAYLRGRHDPDKLRIAAACKATVPLAMTYRELRTALLAFHDELTRLVGRKNAQRWFAHKAGAFDKTLRAAIARCEEPVQNEQRLAGGRPAPATTLKDWNRHNGGRVYFVNDRPFAIDRPTIDDIRVFLRGAGIVSPRIVDFLCDHANQDSLFAVGHLFGLALAKISGKIPSSCGHAHWITRHEHGDGVSLRDRVDYNIVVGESGAITIDPPFHFVQTYDLVDDGRNIHITNVVYDVGGLNGVPSTLRTHLQEALKHVNTALSGT